MQSKNYKIAPEIEFSVYERKVADKPWLVLVHGLQTSKILYEHWFDLPFFNQFSLLAVDLIGFGDSSKLKTSEFEYSVKQQADCIIKLLKHLEITNCHYVGHSLGGMIGTYLLDNTQVALDSMVSMEGNLQLGDCGESARVESLDFQTFANKHFQKLVEKLEFSNLPSSKVRFQSISKVPDYVFYETSINTVKLAKTKKLYKQFEASQCPRLLVIGDSSAYTSRPKGDYANYKIIDNASHFMLLEKPEETIFCIQGFIENTC